MHRRDFLRGALASVALPALPFQTEKSKLKITGVRLVHPRARRPVPTYAPAPGSWSTGGVEVAYPPLRLPVLGADMSWALVFSAGAVVTGLAAARVLGTAY